MDPTVTGALIGGGSAVIVAVAGLWANVRNTSKTTAVSQRAVEVSQHAVEAAQRTIELTERGQVADRYTKAIEQLGSDKLDVRIGGIYALERIARDYACDHPMVMEVLAAFIREHSHEQWPVAQPGREPAERAPRPDVQTAATVIGRRTTKYDNQPINLTDANLSNALLAEAILTGVQFFGANLKGTHLTAADLTGANFADADLTGVVLAGANLTGASLFEANPTDADLTGANLTGANLRDADLTGAHIIGTRLNGADLIDANVSRVDLDGPDLTDAQWPRRAKVPEGWQRDTHSGRLKQAGTN